MTRATRFRAPQVDALRIVPFDELTAIYHRASGITHLVASPVPEIVAILGGTWLSAEDLLARLEASFDLADADRAALDARLVELIEAGLVEAA